MIIEVKPKILNIKNEPETSIFRVCFRKEAYEVTQPISRKPDYLAIRDVAGVYVEMLFKIDKDKSKFETGRLVPEGKPMKIEIPLRMINGLGSRNLIWYTSFRTLLTHRSTDEFILEKSEPFKRGLIEDERVLCNGYYCAHFKYCKFFNHSQTSFSKTVNLGLNLEGSI